MSRFIAIPCVLLLAVILSTLPTHAQTANPDDIPYKIIFDPTDVVMHTRHENKEGLFITVKFSVELHGTGQRINSSDYKIAIEEDGKLVKEIDVPVPKPVEDLSVVMAVHTSSSMKGKRMEQVRVASDTFLKRLPSRADCGLILFNHEMRQTIEPILQREPLVAAIHGVQPRGGTAYLDAAKKGIDMLKGIPHDKALVLITNGIDLNSKATVPEIIALASNKQNKIRIFTIGIGEPGKLEQVSSVLVLDHSGSMLEPADKNDPVRKIEALHRAAVRFVDMIPSTAKTTLIPFSSKVDAPLPFSNNKYRLKQSIQDLRADGETALFDAVFDALCTLEAENPKGKRVVVAMTDGVDNSSRRRVEEVIDRAKEAKIPLYLLGFGREGELDAATMKRMAQETGGQFYHARNEKDLMDIFENLSISIHDDGIDEDTLRQLAGATGGQYFPAKNVADLQLILDRVTQDIQKQVHQVTFPSLIQSNDGRLRQISLKLLHRGQVQKVETGQAQVHGVVIAESNHLVYLVFLGVLGLLLALPEWLKRTSIP